MDIPTQSELLAKIEAFCRRHDMAETRFGRDAVNNPAFLSGLRREPPVSPTLETLNKVSDFMRRADAALPPPTPPRGEEEVQLPFGQAPASTAGASSPISSSTTVPLPLAPRSASSPTSSCSDTDEVKAA